MDLRSSRLLSSRLQLNDYVWKAAIDPSDQAIKFKWHYWKVARTVAQKSTSTSGVNNLQRDAESLNLHDVAMISSLGLMMTRL